MSRQKSENSKSAIGSLVSVTVITYNSARYVLETLESIKAQTYHDVELIVSDDCSSDDTVEICQRWIAKNKHRFLRTELLTSDHNTGIPANGNRAIRASRGEWIKGIAGDDLLTPECVYCNLKYVQQTREHIKILFSNAVPFTVDKDGRRVTYPLGTTSARLLHFGGLSSHEQFEEILNGYTLPAPSVFFRRKLMLQYPYNELYKYLDDIPQWYKLTYNGVKLHYFDFDSAMYRVSDDSVTRSSTCYFPEVKHQMSALFFWNERIGYLADKKYARYYNGARRELLYLDLVDCLLGNRKTKLHSLALRIIKWWVFHFVNFKRSEQ